MVFETYESFAAEYTKVFRAMMSYTLEQVGSGINAEKMAELAEAYPDWAERAESES